MRKIESIQRRVKLRKNFFVTSIVTLVLWILIVVVIFFLDPEKNGSIPLFFVLTFLALLFTLSIVLANTRRGLIASFCLTLFLLLCYLKVGTLINFILILALGLTVDYYFSKKQNWY